MTTAAAPAGRRSTTELAITGMTCASCAMRIEKKLNRLEGVTATVNYATAGARVSHPESVALADLVGTVEHLGYGASLPAGDEEADDEAGLLRTRLLMSLVLTVPVIALAMVPAWQFPAWQWVSLVLAAPVVLLGSWPFHRAAAVNLRHAAATMDTLISLGTLAALAWSVWALVFGDAGMIGMRHGFSLAPGAGDAIYLETAAAVTTFVLAGRWAEARAKRRAGAALRALLDLGAKDVAVLRDGVEGRIPVEALAVGDEFVVRPGERVATDGVVVDGIGAVDASTVTGESVPVEVSPGDEVVGATVAVGSRLVVRATRVGADTQLARIARRVAQAQNGKAQVQRLADRVSAVFVPVVVVIAAATFAGWLAFGGGLTAAFTAAVAVLVIACPCALGLATPTALMVGTGRGAQLGILLRGPEVLESTRRVDTVVLDKTGTLTTGVMRLAHPERVDRTALRLAGAVEDGSSHPLARAITEAARTTGLLPTVTGAGSVDGLGVVGTVHVGETAHEVVVGRPRLLAEHGMPLSPALAAHVEAVRAGGATAVVVGWDGAAREVLPVTDTLRDSAPAAVAALRELGVHPVVLTGDHPTAARAVAARAGIDDVRAEVLPEQKADAVAELQRQGHVVAMVGDGVNDAAALAQADLGLAMGAGTDAAIEAGDVTLVRDDLGAVPDALRLARRTLGTIRGNLFWAFAYNVAALPLAAFGLLNPMIAGAAMAFSSVFVVTNSLRLRRFTPGVRG
ncbi:cation-translocating P-type ATPase [Actinomycetospora sp. TBRC 11914]|uniref:heavy metal translocating P-type ATPase n=1 Tax=Actinomycetospora sp. TBRC 11914 TaxID=2729387 RepID=UPI00145ED2D6|nr:heavy metal translocating P-type ATPase [Actinomycetospora sp. TBRC 11914]NMO91116.1 heavy metal translocating P-type ATPase [Actinomycetospora sp. TBRC 11914]